MLKIMLCNLIGLALVAQNATQQTRDGARAAAGTATIRGRIVSALLRLGEERATRARCPRKVGEVECLVSIPGLALGFHDARPNRQEFSPRRSVQM